MKWISVDESLPETESQFHMVIVATDHGIGVAHYHKLDGFSSVHLGGNQQYSRVHVTHWMYLPEPPTK
ncbi:DUF551 domain-containing protein [Lonsdalea quercina]|uniref:DUF551 domain-containing protein n=1 Tax=Lonsdalea quercina TaxID=71657 RepID=UPI003974D6F7